MRRRPRRDGIDRRCGGAGVVEPNLSVLHAARHRMYVRVLETRKQQAALQVYYFGGGSDETIGRVGIADVDDPAFAHGDRARPGTGGINGVHVTIAEYQIRVAWTSRWASFGSARDEAECPCRGGVTPEPSYHAMP
jgi:hypothetical protein